MMRPVGKPHSLQLLHRERVSLLAAYTLIEERQRHVFEGVLIVDEIERLEYEPYHAVAQLGGAVFREVLDLHPVERVGAGIVIVEDTEDVEEG